MPNDTRTPGSQATKQLLFEDIKRKSVQSLVWSFLTNILTRIITPFYTIVLARLLTPDDYGVVAISSLVIALLNILQTMGLGQALVQRDDKVDEAANVVFWANLILSLTVYAVLYFASPTISDFFKEPRVTPVIRVMGLQLVIGAFGTVQEALLRHQLKFKELFWFQLLPSVVPGVLCICLALMGYGYWSLVYGTLTGTLTGVLVLWIQSPWRPSLNINIGLAKTMAGFGIMVAIESFASWVYDYFDNTVVGHYLGVQELGLYSLGYRIAMMIIMFFVLPVTSVAYSSFSRLQSDLLKLQEVFLRLTRLIAMIVVPVCLGLATVSENVAIVVFGSKWEGLGPILLCMAIMPGLSFLWFLVPQAFRAIGRPDLNAKMSMAFLAYVIPLFILAAQHGLQVFTIARMSVGFVTMPYVVYLTVRFLKVPWNFLWTCSRESFLASGVMVVIVYTAAGVLRLGIGKVSTSGLVFLIGLGVVTYSIASLKLNREDTYFVVDKIKHQLIMGRNRGAL